MVVLAADLRGEDRGEQIVGAHPQERRRHALAALEAQERERARGVPAPARPEHRAPGAPPARAPRARPLGAEQLEDRLEREAVLRAEREQDAVVGGRGLELEVEGAAEALAQREAPGAVDAAAEGRVEDELHAARLVEEALGDDRVLRGHRAERRAAPPRRSRARARAPGRVERARARRARRPSPPTASPRARRGAAISSRSAPTSRRELARARRRLAEPERDGRRRAPARPRPSTLPVSTRRIRHEVLPSRKTSPAIDSIAKSSSTVPTLVALGLEHDVVVGVVGDGAARGERGEARAAAAAEAPVHARRGGGARPRARGAWRRPRRAWSTHRVEVVARELARRARRARTSAKSSSSPTVLGGGDGDDLLREDVERRVAQRDRVDDARARAARTSAAHSTSWSRVSGKKPALRRARRARGRSGRRAGARSRSSAASRADAREIDRADVDAELERGGRDDDARARRP